MKFFLAILVLSVTIPLGVCKAQPPITALQFSPAGKQLLAGSQAGVVIHSWPELKPMGKLETKCSHVLALAFSPDGRTLAIAGGRPGEQGCAELWDWETKTLTTTFNPGSDTLLDACWNSAGDTLLCGSADGNGYLISLSEKSSVLPLKGHSRAVTCVAWLAKSDLLITGGNDENLLVFNGRTKETTRTFNNHTAAIESIAPQPGDWPGPEMLVSAGGDNTIRLWQPAIGRMVRFTRLESAPLDVGWTAGGESIVVSCADGQIRFINPATAEVIRTLPALSGWAYSLAVHPSDNSLAAGGSKGEIMRVQLEQTKQ